MTPNPPNHRWKMSDQNPDVVELPYKTAKSKTTMGTPGSPGAAASGPYSLATGSLGMDKSTLKVHLPDGSFNVVRFGDATDIKVSCKHKYFQPKKSLFNLHQMSFSRRAVHHYNAAKGGNKVKESTVFGNMEKLKSDIFWGYFPNTVWVSDFDFDIASLYFDKIVKEGRAKLDRYFLSKQP